MGNKHSRNKILAASRSGLDSPTVSYRSDGKSDSPVVRVRSSSTSTNNESISGVKNSIKNRPSSECIDRRNSRERKSTMSVSMASQAIINSCYDNAHEDIAKRVYMRVAQKREDFADFCETLSGQQWNDMVDKMKEFLDKVIAAVGKDNEIQKLSEQFGEWHVLLRPVGFKPDFFAAAAEAVTKECVHLDQAAHPPTETFLAWAELITLMFSAVRDGYYAEVRRQRKQSSFYGNGKNSLDLSTDGSDEGNGEINSHLSVVNEENVDATSCNGVEKTRL